MNLSTFCTACGEDHGTIAGKLACPRARLPVEGEDTGALRRIMGTERMREERPGEADFIQRKWW